MFLTATIITKQMHPSLIGYYTFCLVIAFSNSDIIIYIIYIYIYIYIYTFVQQWVAAYIIPTFKVLMYRSLSTLCGQRLFFD